MNLTQVSTNIENVIGLAIFLSTMLLILCYSKPVYAEEPIGDVVFSRGAVSAQTAGGQIRLLGKDADVFRTDTITTAPKSFAVIKLNDGTRLSIRPDSILAISDYADKAGEESATMRLFRGGLRAISGLISKNDPDAFKIKTAVATIGIRGTEFDARLCEADCANEAREMTVKKAAIKSSVVGRVAFIKGSVSAKKTGGKSRTLTRGAPLYENDEITTAKDAHVILVFRDEGRVTLKPETQFSIEKYNYEKDSPESDSAFFRLAKGGMRALSGYMSKRNPDKYGVRTAVATIGIRGTGFDLLWLGPCTTSPGCGLVASVWEGGISSTNDSGTDDIGLNQTARISAINLSPELIDTAPIFNVPRPDSVDVDFENLFATQKENGEQQGLYVACYEGHCAMLQEDKQLDLGAGEAGFASLDGQQLVRLEQIEAFQQDDPYLNSINELFDTLYEILDDNVIEETEFECVVQ
ncbi:MAG: hypothetical protein GKR93_19930 [Gammaproteobacteria bacterium]|nr:hypothetical protein [Gammaproteobacteria bacterium]